MWIKMVMIYCEVPFQYLLQGLTKQVLNQQSI